MKKITRQTFTFSVVFTMIFSMFMSLEGIMTKSLALSCPQLTYDVVNQYYEIWDADDLETMSCRVNSTNAQTTSDPMFVDNEASYKLMADIDMIGVTDWVPIGTSFSPFSGSFDGDGHTISNLVINQTTTYGETYNSWFEMHSAGFFGSVVSGMIEDVTLDNFSIAVEPIQFSTLLENDDRMIFAGLLAAAIDNARIDKVEIINSELSFIDFSKDLNEVIIKVGGVSGYSNHSLITSTHVSADIHLDDHATFNSNYVLFTYAGGFIGNAHDTQIGLSKFKGDITVNVATYFESFVGGLVGSADFYARNGLKATMIQIEPQFSQNEVVANISYDNQEELTYYTHIGGMFGFLYNGSIISGSALKTTIQAKILTNDVYVGGLIGRGIDANIIFSRFEGDINIYETYLSYVGGLVGGLDGESVIHQSYATGDMDIESHYVTAGGLIGVIDYWGRSVATLAEIEQIGGLSLLNVYSRMNMTITNYEPIMDLSIQRDGPNHVGGLAGVIFGDTTQIQYGYYAGTVELVQGDFVVDALFNFIEMTIRGVTPFNDLYYDADLLDEVASSLHGEPKSTSEMKTQSTFTNFDFEEIWVRSDAYNDGYPTFRWGRYLVQFVPNNDTIIPDQLTLRAVAPTDPVKQDHTFEGWRLPSVTEHYAFGVLLDQDIVLTAHYLTNLKILVEGTPSLNPKAKGLETAVTYTDQERNESILTKLVITILDEIDADEEALVNAYLEALDKNYKNILFLDISLFKIVGDVQTKITKANNMIEISFVLPEAYRSDPFVFLHVKEGVVESLDYEYDEVTFVITFKTDEFSSFVLAAEDVPLDEIPDTSDRSNSFAWWMLLFGAMLVLLTSKKRKLS